MRYAIIGASDLEQDENEIPLDKKNKKWVTFFDWTVTVDGSACANKATTASGRESVCKVLFFEVSLSFILS